jgi:hypothetical protein
MIPYATGGKNHVMTMTPYNGVILAMPGRHQKDTSPEGGDFVVMVSDERLGWVNHQFTHDDLFLDIEKKCGDDLYTTEQFFVDYVKVVFGEDPAKLDWHRPTYHLLPENSGDEGELWTDSLHPQTFLYAVQCLAIAEHRRYHQHEAKGGGRFLPARFAGGIVEGLWNAEDCKKVQRRGRMGLDHLISVHGSPKSLKEIYASAQESNS